MNHSTPGLPVHHQLPEFTKTHVHWISDAIQPSHLLSSPSPPTLNLSQHQGVFNCASSKSLNIYTLALKNKLDYFLHWSDCLLGSEISPHCEMNIPTCARGTSTPGVCSTSVHGEISDSASAGPTFSNLYVRMTCLTEPRY